MVAKGTTLDEPGIHPVRMQLYAQIYDRADRSSRKGLRRYQFDAVPPFKALVGGFFEHKDIPLGKVLEHQSSFLASAIYEVKYVMVAGYWGSFHESSIIWIQE